MERYLSKKEASAVTGLSVKTLERAIRRKALRAARTGFRVVRIAYSELVRFMNGGGAAEGGRS